MSTEFPTYPKIETVYNRGIGGVCQIGQWRTAEIEYLKDAPWLWTEKVDGTNIRVLWDGERVSFGGRTDNAQMFMPLVSYLQNTFPPSRFTDQPAPLILYGEGFGAKIGGQGGRYCPDGVGFVLFDVLLRGFWLPFFGCQNMARTLGIRSVPIIDEGSLHDATELVVAGFPSEWGGFPAEGLVVRPSITLLDRNHRRVIAKLKSRDF